MVNWWTMARLRSMAAPKVGRDRPGTDPEGVGTLHQGEDLGIAQQGFGGDAAPVQTNAAQLVPFHDGDRHAQLGGTDGGDVAAGTRSHDDQAPHHGAPSRSARRR
jgi:hypothetical protein